MRGLLGGCFTLAIATPAWAETSVRLGDDLKLSPFVQIQVDGASFSQSAPGGQAAGVNLKRARLGGRLDVADQVDLGLIWDFGHSPGAVGRLFEAKASYIGLRPFALTVGVFKVNYSLEYMQSAGDLLFLERASIVSIASDLAAGIHREGIQLQADGDRYIVSLAGTAGTPGPGRDGDQRAIVGRAAGLAYRTSELAIHTGVSGEWVFRPANDIGRPEEVSFSDQTELAVDKVTPSLSTGRFATRSAGAFGPELGAAWNRLWVQGEYYALVVNQQASAGGATRTFDGWYTQAAYTLFGTPRKWERKIGGWGSPKPAKRFDPAAGQFGAVEIGMRFSTVNLNDATIRGGRQNVVSAGVNWWPVEPLRFSAMYEHGTITGGNLPRSIDAVALRGQIQF